MARLSIDLEVGAWGCIDRWARPFQAGVSPGRGRQARGLGSTRPSDAEPARGTKAPRLEPRPQARSARSTRDDDGSISPRGGSLSGLGPVGHQNDEPAQLALAVEDLGLDAQARVASARRNQGLQDGSGALDGKRRNRG